MKRDYSFDVAIFYGQEWSFPSKSTVLRGQRYYKQIAFTKLTCPYRFDKWKRKRNHDIFVYKEEEC